MFIYLDRGNSLPRSRSKLGCTEVLSIFMPALAIPKLNFGLSKSRCQMSHTRVLYLVPIVINGKLWKLCLQARKGGKNRARQAGGREMEPRLWLLLGRLHLPARVHKSSVRVPTSDIPKKSCWLYVMQTLHIRVFYSFIMRDDVVCVLRMFFVI